MIHLSCCIVVIEDCGCNVCMCFYAHHLLIWMIVPQQSHFRDF